jgi:hypothetical protein
MLLQTMSYSEPGTSSYRNAAEAITRIQQILYLNIFAGQSPRKYYFIDRSIVTPANLPLERTHMYGRILVDKQD